MDPREHGGKTEPIGRRAEVESGSWRFEVELRDPQSKAELMTLYQGRSEQGAEGRQRRCGRGTGWLWQMRREREAERDHLLKKES